MWSPSPSTPWTVGRRSPNGLGFIECETLSRCDRGSSEQTGRVGDVKNDMADPEEIGTKGRDPGKVDGLPTIVAGARRRPETFPLVVTLLHNPTEFRTDLVFGKKLVITRKFWVWLTLSPKDETKIYPFIKRKNHLLSQSRVYLNQSRRSCVRILHFVRVWDVPGVGGVVIQGSVYTQAPRGPFISSKCNSSARCVRSSRLQRGSGCLGPDDWIPIPTYLFQV